jgi:thiamine pyrophosphate-dependent acetolactate synthase large subunit-like protein
LVVINNGGYSSIRQTQEKFGLHQTGNSVNIPSVRDLAAAFGWTCSTDLSDLNAARVFEITVDPDQKFLPKWEFK